MNMVRAWAISTIITASPLMPLALGIKFSLVV
nr:MAG TPA: hypothetical protein [Caudoviricetes sp.]